MPFKDINTEFTPSDRASVQSSTRHTHAVIRGSIRGSEKTWIRKEMSDPGVARMEMMAQEFFRLITPHQPETRLMVNPDNGRHYILSEEVPGYRNLPAEPQNFTSGRYTGLGQIMVGSLYLQEVDLKNGNVGLDDKGRVIKIDGDWCFAEDRLKHPSKHYPLTENGIRALPRAHDFYAFNWLDYVTEECKHPQSMLVDAHLQNAKPFRNEVNQALLKICVIPDKFLEQFVGTYFPAEGRYFTKFLKQRRDMLQASALQNNSFKAYLNTPEANEAVLNLTETMNSFVANGENTLISDGEQAQIKSLVNERFIGVKYAPQHEPNRDQILNINVIGSRATQPIIQSIKTLLQEIYDARVNDQDFYVTKFVEVQIQLLDRQKNNVASLNDFLNRIKKAHKDVCAPEAQAVTNTAHHFRRRSNFSTIGMKNKAKRIEDALISIPLDKRRNVITEKCASPNAVQEALAARRIRGRSNMLVYKDSENQIDMNRAAPTFKKLKDEFESLRKQETSGDETKHSGGGIPPLRKR